MTILEASQKLHVSKTTIVNWLRNDWLEREGSGVSDKSVAREFANTPVLVLFRRISKITQTELAAILGVSLDRVYNLEKASFRYWQMMAVLMLCMSCFATAGALDPAPDITVFEGSYLNGALAKYRSNPIEIMGVIDEKSPEGIIVHVSKIAHVYMYRDLPELFVLIEGYPKEKDKFLGDTILVRASLTGRTYERRSGYRPIPVYDASKWP